MKIKLIAFGKLKTPGFSLTREDLVKRYRPWFDFEEIELKTHQENSKEKEMQLFLNHFPENQNATLIVLDDKGESLSTKQWAMMLKEFEEQSIQKLVFGIGSHQGFHPDLLQKAKKVVSFGPQTLSHEIARIVLYEQIYRAYSLNKGHPYHHE